MIKRITIKNFKSLQKVDLKLGQLNVFIGTNASGKSNFFDGLRMLRGVAGGFPVKELFEGGANTISGEVWPGIRGGLGNAIYVPFRGDRPSLKQEATVGVELTSPMGEIGYEFSFNASGMTTNERLLRNNKEAFFFKDGEAFFRWGDKELIASYPSPFSGSQLIIALRSGLAGNYLSLIQTWIKHLQGIQLLELEPQVLRRYGSAADVIHMGEHGENFASLVRNICQNLKTKESYLSWLRELRPQEVEDVTILSGAVGEPLFALSEGGREVPAPVLSDGTLRFAAISASFFQEDPAKTDQYESEPLKTIGLEEIENGIHGTRLRLLVELLRTHATLGKTQIFATTHSPLVLDWLKPEEYQTTFLCKRDEKTGESKICPLTEIPNFNEVAQKRPLSELFAEGWMEAAV